MKLTDNELFEILNFFYFKGCKLLKNIDKNAFYRISIPKIFGICMKERNIERKVSFI
jgi:hypothetical protein